MATSSDSTRYCVDGVEGPDDVATREPNACGGHDFTGNVWEWVADGFQVEPPSGPDPLGALPETGFRTVRGGSFASEAPWVSLASRYDLNPTYDGTSDEADPEGPDLGFRLARTRDDACD